MTPLPDLQVRGIGGGEQGGISGPAGGEGSCRGRAVQGWHGGRCWVWAGRVGLMSGAREQCRAKG